MIAEVIEAYETRRWPDGKVAGGEGLRPYPPKKLQSLKRCGLGKPRPVIERGPPPSGRALTPVALAAGQPNAWRRRSVIWWAISSGGIPARGES